MTKRSPEEAVQDEIAAEEALIERLEEQERRRESALRAAHDLLKGTRDAIQEHRQRAADLRNALAALQGKPAEDPE